MKAHPLWPLSRWLKLSLVATAALSSASVGLIVPIPNAKANDGQISIVNQNVDTLVEEANRLRDQGNLAGATAIWKQILDLSEKELGPDHPNVAHSLNNLAMLLKAQKQYATAEALYQRSLSIFEKVLGRDHLYVAASLNNLAALLNYQGQYAAAERHCRRSLAIREKALGQYHPDVAQSLNNLAELLRYQGKYAQAKPLYIRSLTIIERRLGPNHLASAPALTNLARLLQAQGQYAAAESLDRRSLVIREKAFGADQPSVVNNLNNLASVLQAQGKYAAALPLVQRTLAIREKEFGSNHPDVAISLDYLARLLQAQGQYVAAESLDRRSLAIREKAFGPDHLDVATSLNNLATLLSDQGQYSAAEPLYRRSLAIFEKRLGAEHLDVASSLHNLAWLLQAQGKYGAAEPLFRRSIATREKKLGPDHPDVAISLANLARLLNNQGQESAAESLYRRSLAINEKSLGPDHPIVATDLHNLSSLLQEQGKYIPAESLCRRALNIYAKTLGPTHPYFAVSLNSLAIILNSQKKYSEAEKILRRVLTISERALGAEHPNVATGLNNLASLLSDKGDFASAELLYRRSLAIIEKRLGQDHYEASIRLANLATLHADQNQYALSLSLYYRSLAIESGWLIRELPLLPVEVRSAQLRKTSQGWQAPFALIDRYPPAAQLALETRLNRQGLLPEIEQRQAQLLNAPGVDKGKLEQLQALIQKLASVTLAPERRAAVREQRDRLQAEFYRQQPDLQIRSVSVSDVAKALPADGVLVEFQRFHPYDGRRPKEQRWGAPRYIALVLKPNGSINAVPLGPATAIDATVHQSLNAAAEGLSDAEALWTQLSNQVLRPLLPHLSGIRQWFLSPDGELNRVPFAALPAPQQPSTPLAAAVQLRLLTTGRELIRLQQPAPSAGAAVVMANPSYDRHGVMTVAATQPDAAAALAQRRSGDLASNRWLPLPGTEREGQQVASLLGTHLISGSGATTMALQQQQGPRVLHVATHGFFVADQESSPSDPLRTIQEQAPQLRAFRGEEPLLRSGLVLAGANQPDLDPKDDGYLTASEALMLKLKGTELVVLSACSTAQGDIRTGEGVYGLQRALTVAGARSTLLSLWKVDDAATAEFMARFYRRLKAGEGRADALAAVQQEFRDGKTGNDTWREPAYWAAWQLVGDWRPIQGL